uniref:Protein TOPAZ1 n=1 Tax=Poecilia mexicana TaxID=48701 RepID=A0A3B3YBS7_9TELE
MTSDNIGVGPKQAFIINYFLLNTFFKNVYLVAVLLVSMFPSSNRVKLNRLALKDVVGLKLAPRRRKTPKAAIDISPDSSRRHQNVLSNPLSVEETASVSGDRNESSQTVPEPKNLEKQNDALKDNLKGKLKGNYAVTQKVKWRNDLQSCTGDNMEHKRSGPNTKEFVQDTHLNLSELAGSEGCLRRSVGASLCIVCGECKYISSRQRTLGKQKPKTSTPESGPSPTMVKIYGRKRAVETVEKIVVWINEYPKVTLCDIAATYDICSHNCGYILPDDLKNKKMRCFKRDMRAGFRIWPSCIGHNSEQGGETKNSTSSPSVQSGNSICQAESLTEQHKHPEEGTASEVSTPSEHFYNGWTDVDATAPAPFLKSKRTEDDEIRTCVLDQYQLDNAGLESDPIALGIHRDKRMKLGDGVECSRVCSTASKENEVISRPDQNIFSPTEYDTFQMSPVLFSENDELNVDEPELFTCQRVRPYSRELLSSCARTYKSWPFPNSQPRCKVGASATACSETGSSQRSPIDSVTKNSNLHSSSTGENQNMTKLRTVQQPVQSGKSVAPLHCRSVPSSGPGQLGMEPDVGAVSTFLLNRLETNDSTSTTTTHKVLSLSDWEAASALSNSSDPSSSGLSATVFSPLPSMFLSGKIQNTLGKTVEEPQLSTCSPLSFALPNNSYQSLVSSIGFSCDQNNNDECLPMKSPPRLEPYDASPFKPKHLCNVPRQNYVDFDSDGFLLPPELSPITSPYRRILGCTSFESLESLEDNEEVMNKEETPTDFYLEQVANGNTETSSSSSEHFSKEMEGATTPSMPTDITAFKSLSSPSNTEVHGDEDIKETLDDTEKNVEDSKRSFKQVPLSPKVQATVGSNVQTEGSLSPSSHGEEHTEEEDEEEQCSSTEEESSSYDTEDDQREAEGTKEPETDVLDEVTAYEQDILLVDVVQEDPELFENLPEKSLLNLGPVRDTAPPKKKPIPAIKFSLKTTRSSSVFDQKVTTVTVDLRDDCTEIADEMESRPWRPRCSNITTKNQNPYPQSEHLGRSDRNNSKMDGSLESNFGRLIHPHVTSRIGQCMKNPTNMTDFRRQKSNEYCRQYFSESLSCGFKMCRFQHLPAEGDEKFCVETVTKFAKNPACLQKAGAVFTGYYQNSPPGAYFSMPVLLTLLWALLKAGMVSNVFSVLRVSLAHNIVPGHEFLLALFNYVRDKDLMSFVPELMQLTFKMAGVGLELSLDCIDNVKHSPMFQQAAHHNSHNSPASTQNPEYLNLVHGIVEIELCAKQEDWKRMGEVYRSVCQFSQHQNQVERISGRIAIALLSESKDKVSLPFAAFAESVRQNESEENLVKTFVGRIGVSLMLRYHKNHHWIKGRRVVEVMSALKVDYTTLKSLFGNEDGASRCCLITVATELFLLSGSVEGALSTLREHNWFLSSGLWPCEPTDLEARTNLLRRLAGKTSHRDTFEVLCNLPGVKEPSDLIDIDRRCSRNWADKTCGSGRGKSSNVNITGLPSRKNLIISCLKPQGVHVNPPDSLSAGYYPDVSAAPGLMALVVPCQLGEVELALALEMFVAFNASAILPLSDTATSSLSITLKRTQTCEGDYISAGNRLLSAACLPQPKLTVRYTAVNSSQEQLFRLDVSSARRWLRHNHLWASEMWTQRPKSVNPN